MMSFQTGGGGIPLTSTKTSPLVAPPESERPQKQQDTWKVREWICYHGFEQRFDELSLEGVLFVPEHQIEWEMFVGSISCKGRGDTLNMLR